jgi:hypothetical protein
VRSGGWSSRRHSNDERQLCSASFRNRRAREGKQGERGEDGPSWARPQVFSTRLGQVAALLHAWEETVAPACGHAEPAGRLPRLGWARCTGKGARRWAHGGPRSTTKVLRSTVRQGIARTPRGRRGRSARTTRGTWRRRRVPHFLFHLGVFANAKLKKVTTNLKIFKTKSCRGAIGVYFHKGRPMFW